MKDFNDKGFILRPSFVFGDRQVARGVSIPLWILGKPLQTVLTLPGFSELQNLPGMKAVLAPPVSVEDVGTVAAAAAAGALDGTDGNILDVPSIIRIAKCMNAVEKLRD